MRNASPSQSELHKNTADTGAKGVQVQGVYGGWAWVRLGTAVAQRRACSEPLGELFGPFVRERCRFHRVSWDYVEEMIYSKIA